MQQWESFWKTDKIRTCKKKKQRQKIRKKKLIRCSLPITKVIIPGIAILLKKWLPLNDRQLPICEGQYLSLTSEECWEFAPCSVVVEHIPTSIWPALSYGYKLFTNGRPRNSGVLFLDSAPRHGGAKLRPTCSMAFIPFRSNEKGKEVRRSRWLSYSLHIWWNLFFVKTLFCWCYFQIAANKWLAWGDMSWLCSLPQGILLYVVS